MSAINNLLEDLRYLGSRMLGGKSREQMAEEERKAAEQKAREEQFAAMEREKKERETEEKKQNDLVQEITSALKSNEGVTYWLKIISKGATNDDLFSGSGILTQEFKLEISVGEKFTAELSVVNNPEYYQSYEVNSFLDWNHYKVSEPKVTQKELADSLSKERYTEILRELKNCKQISRCIDHLKKINTPSFLSLYKNEWMSTFRCYGKDLGALRLDNAEDGYCISFSGKRIPFNGKTFEFSKMELSAALGLRDCRDISRRRQKLSATPDLSGTVLPLCLIPNSALKNAPPFKSAVPKGSACARLLA